MRRTIEIHRSYRKALIYPEPLEPRRAPAKKNTRRWCRGRIGVEHEPAWRCEPYAFLKTFMVFACTVCGRHLDSCAGQHPACKCGRHRPEA